MIHHDNASIHQAEVPGVAEAAINAESPIGLAVKIAGGTAEEIEAQVADTYNEVYAKHSKDSLGMSLFKTLLTNYWTPEKSLEEYTKASDLVKNNELINTKIKGHLLDLYAAGHSVKSLGL